jgi:hypothetical protein
MCDAPPILDEARLHLLNASLRLVKDEFVARLYELFQWSRLEPLPSEAVGGVAPLEAKA